MYKAGRCSLLALATRGGRRSLAKAILESASKRFSVALTTLPWLATTIRLLGPLVGTALRKGVAAPAATPLLSPTCASSEHPEKRIKISNLGNRIL